MGYNHADYRNASRKGRRIVVQNKVWLYNVQKGMCCSCGTGMLPVREGIKFCGASATREHVFPIGRFSKEASRKRWCVEGDGNLALSHHRCNSKKQSRMPTGCELLFLVYVEMRRADKDSVGFEWPIPSSLRGKMRLPPPSGSGTLRSLEAVLASGSGRAQRRRGNRPLMKHMRRINKSKGRK